MSRRPSAPVEERVAAVGRLRGERDEATVAEGLRAGLCDPSAPVVARAARLAVELARSDLAEELTATFRRFLDDPRARDPGCAAKTALAGALVDLELPEIEVFRRGIHVVQWEPVYGGRVDVAAELRAHCAVGLSGTADQQVINDLADLLADPEPAARSGAIRAIAASGRLEGPPLLRFKARLGDDNPEVLGECFSALLAVDPEGSFNVVVDALDSEDDAVAEAAALALGGSRLEPAFVVLRDAAERFVCGERRRMMLTSIALLRLDVAVDHLLELAMDGPIGTASDAVRALAVLRHDGDLRRRAEAVVDRRGDPVLAEALASGFAD